jgi:hypothetical protein
MIRNAGDDGFRLPPGIASSLSGSPAFPQTYDLLRLKRSKLPPLPDTVRNGGRERFIR